MNAELIDLKIYEGRAQAARRIGHQCVLYRPQDSTWENEVGELHCALSTEGSYKKPALYGKAVWYGDIDGRLTRPGDYLVRLFDRATWFIAAQQPLLPIVMIEAPRTLTLARQAPVAGVGAVTYSGVIAPTVLASAWPASILFTGGGGAAAGLPGDVPEAAWRILWPKSFPLTVEASDILTDDLGRRFEVTAAELTDLGWRLSGNEVHA
jgi:hypothetical protein